MATTTADENKEHVREYLDAWEAGNPDRITDLLAEGFSTTLTTPSGEETTIDTDGLHDLMVGNFNVFSERSYEIHELVAEGNQVMARITYYGVHEGTFLGIEPTGNRVCVEEYFSFEVADGRLTEVNWLGDDLGLLRQLGVELPIET